MGHLLERQWHIHTARCWELPLSLPLLHLGLTAWRGFLIDQGTAAFARLGPKISWSARHPIFLRLFLLLHHIHLRYGLFPGNIFLIFMKLMRLRYVLLLNPLYVSFFCIDRIMQTSATICFNVQSSLCYGPGPGTSGAGAPAAAAHHVPAAAAPKWLGEPRLFP